MADIKTSIRSSLEDDADAFVKAWHGARRETKQIGEMHGPVESPCNQVCVIDDATGSCIGCGRTIDEITEWGTAMPARQQMILNALPKRLAKITTTE